MRGPQKNFLSSEKNDKILLKVLIGLVLLFNIWGGWFNLGLHNTDPYSEGRRTGDALKITKGDHRFGIVPEGQTRYPNGPTYLLLPFICLGADETQTLRWVPFTLAIVAEILLLITFYKLPLEPFKKAFLIVASGFLFDQPGIRNWLGALHEQSYLISITLLLIALALGNIRFVWVFLIVGFISCWIGYDPIPGQAMALFACMFVRALLNSSPKNLALKLAASRTIYFLAGVILAFTIHFVQVSFFYRSAETAARDIFAGATAMAALDYESINPRYYSHIKSIKYVPRYESRSATIVQMLQRFRNPAWVKKGFLSRFFLVTSLLGLYWLVKDPAKIPGFVESFPYFFLALLLSWTLWPFLMPTHVLHHFHFIQRLIFIALFMAPIGVATLTSLPKANDQRY